MKKFLILLSCFTLVIFLTACGNSQKENSNTYTVKTSKKEEPLNLYGTWKQINSDDDKNYQEAKISEDGTIEINWVSEEDDSKSLYWAGSFEAPTKETKKYSWISNNDKEKTEEALLASEDDTKEFNYKNGILSYEASALGTTTTIKMKKQ